MALTILMQVATDTAGVFDSGSASYNANDTAFRTWAEGQGHTVRPFAQSDAVPSNTAQFDIVVFGTSMVSNTASKWDSINVPILSLELTKFIHTQQASVTFASIGDSRLTAWVNPANTIGITLTGVRTLYTSTPLNGYKWLQNTNLAPSVMQYAGHDSSASRATGIAIEAGATLLNSATCPSRRAVLPFDEFSLATADALTITTELLNWLVPTPINDVIAPSAIADLTASQNDATVNLTWTASTDAVGVYQYDVYCSSADFTPAPQFYVGSTTGTNFADLTRTPGVWYYKVLAADAADNTSTSNLETIEFIDPSLIGGVLFIVGSLTLTAGDTILRDRMVADGHTLTIRTSADANKSTASFDAIVFSETATPSDAVNYASANVGIVTLEWQTWDAEFGMTNTEFAQSMPTFTNVYTMLHPVTELAGMTPGTYISPSWTATSSGRFVTRGYLDQNEAEIVALLGTDAYSNNIFSFSYEAGKTLANSSIAPGRRIAVGLTEALVTLATAQVIDIFSAAVSWAVGATPSTDYESPSVPVLSGTKTGTYTNDINLSWTAASDNTAVDHYDIYMAGIANFTPQPSYLQGTVAGNTTSFFLENAAEGNRWIKVLAYDAIGNYSASNELAFTIDNDWDNPSTITDLSATYSSPNVTLTWNAATDDTGVDFYEVFRSSSTFSPAPEFSLGTTTSITYDDTSATTGNWFYRVQAVDVAGKRSTSNEATATVGLTPTENWYIKQGGVLVPLHLAGIKQAGIITPIDTTYQK